MAKFHLMHCIPHPRMHGLNGYREIIETVQWGLTQLGHDATYAVNVADLSGTNIVFGAQVLTIDALRQLPPSSIYYNFEQLRGLSKDALRPELHFIGEHFKIWEYSAANFGAWGLLGHDAPKLVPIGYAPLLSRISKLPDQDIDVLIYGATGDKRLSAFHKLSRAGFKCIFASGFYGETRDALIARSKIVLNINLYDFAQIFEAVRVSYLLANKKAVVTILDPDTAIDPDFLSAVKITTVEGIVEDCGRLLKDDVQRASLEQAGYETFIKRDVVKILNSVVNGVPEAG